MTTPNTLADPIRHAERFHGRRPAVTCGATTLDYRSLADRVRRMATWTAERTQRGDRVAIVADNGIDYLVAYLAVPSTGRMLVPVNTRWAAREINACFEDCTPSIVLADPAMADGITWPVIAIDDQFRADVAGSQAITDLGDGTTESDVAGLFYTGGTTGRSKGVMLTHRNLIANTVHAQAAFPSSSTAVYLVQAPMFHVAGSMAILDVVWNGGHQIILPRFSAGASLDAIQRHRVTETLGVPTMLSAQVEEQLANPRDVSSLRSYVHGGSPVAGEVLRRAARAFPGASLVEIYGSTETAPLIVCNPNHVQDLDTDRRRSCGRPIMGVTVVVADPDDEMLPPGEVGEILVRGPNVTVGYWNQPEATAAALRNGWYHMGDAGHFDEDGWLYLRDRVKDVIITGGENVYSTEVEEAIYEHPDVLEATVFGIPNEEWGEAVHAVVVARRSELTPQAVIDHCRGRIAGYKIPKTVEVSDRPLPKSGPGKVLKRELRAPFWEGHERDIS